MINSYIILIFSVVISTCSQILLKKASNIEYSSKIREYLNWRVVVGYGMMVISTILTIIAFKGMDYKNGPVIESLGYIFMMFLSRWFLQEKITRKKVIGNALILVGIAVFYI